MKNKQKRQEQIRKIMIERGCKERQAKNVLQAIEDGRPAPGIGFGPPLIGEKTTTERVLEDYLGGFTTADVARRRIGKKGVSLSTFWRRLRKYVAESDEWSMKSVPT